MPNQYSPGYVKKPRGRPRKDSQPPRQSAVTADDVKTGAVKPGFTEAEERPQGKKEAEPSGRGPGRPSNAAKLKDDVSGVLALGVTLTDNVVHWLFPAGWTAEDQLSAQEIGAVTASVTEEIMKRPKLAARFTMLADAQDKAGVGLLVTSIALPRLARHKLLPSFLGRAIMQAMGKQMPPEAVPPVSPDPEHTGPDLAPTADDLPPSAPPPMPMREREVIAAAPASVGLDRTAKGANSLSGV